MITSRADFGGGPQHLFLLIKYLKDHFNIFCACPDDFPYKSRYESLIGTDHICIIPHREFSVKALFEVKRFTRSRDIKLIHSHGKGAGIYGRLLSMLTKIPAVHTFHGLHIDNYDPFRKLFFLTVEKILSLFTSRFICVSGSEFKRVVSSKIAPESKIVVICNGVETTGDQPQDKVLNNHVKKILHITRFDFAKNSLLLIPIAERLRENTEDFKIVIVGSGEEESKFKEEVIKRNLNDFFEMIGNSADLMNFYSEAFCYLSTSRWEGLPLALMEAMSFGIPVVASDVPGNNDLVEHNKTGFLFNINDPAEAVKYLSILLDNNTLRKNLSASSKEKIMKNFSASEMAEKTGYLYGKIIY
jgi:glycosyltransferase involved in cell wall biosynthesis